MKKITTLLGICVFMIGIVTIFSGVASALTIVGDPFIGHSVDQYFRVEGFSSVDHFDVYMQSGTLKTWNDFSDTSWKTDSFSTSHLSCSGDSVASLLFKAEFVGELSQYLKFDFISQYQGKIKEWTTLIWDGVWHCQNNNSVPDAGIMWLLGPAFIALGILGRKKAKG